jgi:two-component sensor histidine kinase
MRYVLFAVVLAVFHEGSTQSKSELWNQVNSGTAIQQYDALSKLTNVYSYDQTDSALWCSLEMVRLAKEMRDYVLIGDAFKLTSVYYSSAGLYDQALTDAYMAISYYDSANTSDRLVKIGDIYHNMGWIFSLLGEHDKTVSFFHKGMKVRPVISRLDSIDQTNSLHALGTFYYLYDPKFDSSEYYFKKCIQWMEVLHMPLEDVARAEVELCNAWMLMGKYAESKDLIQKIRTYPPDSISKYVVQYTYYLDGLYLHFQGDTEKALSYFDAVYSWIIESGNQHAEIGINALRQMVETAENGGLYKRAYKYLSKLRTIEQETVFKDRQRTTKTLEIVNETKRKEQLIDIQEAEIAFQNQVIWASLVGLSVIFALTLFLYQSRRKVHAKNQKIEMLMRELHHRVKNNLQVISSLLGLQSMKLQDAIAKQAVSEGKQRIKAMSLIHQKLYQQDEVSALDVNEYISALVNDLADSFGFRDKGRVIIDVPSISLNADTSLPIGLIVNELVTNALKYAFRDIEEPILELKLIQQTNSSYMLFVRDNGPGLPANFDLTKAESFGLKLVNILIKQLNASIEWVYEDGLQYQISFQSVK